jgi:hypothetical protein
MKQTGPKGIKKLQNNKVAHLRALAPHYNKKTDPKKS